MTNMATENEPRAMEVFTFGEPEAVLDRREIFDYFESNLIDGKWYEMPVSVDGLTRMLRAGVHHASAIDLKAKILASTFRPHPRLSRTTLLKVAKEYLVFGNAYLEEPRNRLGEGMQFQHSLAKYTRRHADLQTFGFMPRWGEVHIFRKAASATSWSRMWIRRFMDCRSIWPACRPACSMSRPPCFVGATTQMAATRGSFCT